MRGPMQAVVAGCFAAFASVVGKLAVAEESIEKLCVASEDWLNNNLSSVAFLPCSSIIIYLRLVCFGLIFLCNAVMWIFFVKSLQNCSSSVLATVINTAANFLLSAMFGQILFKERLSVMWWAGVSIVITGLVLIHRGQSKDEKVKDKQSRDEKNEDKLS